VSDRAGAGTPASGAMMVPSGSDPACTGTQPVPLYAHGTSTNRNFNIADIGECSLQEFAGQLSSFTSEEKEYDFVGQACGIRPNEIV